MCLRDHSRPLTAYKWGRVVSLEFSVNPVNSLLNILFILIFFLVVRVFLCAAARCAGPSSQLLISLVSVIVVVVGVRLIASFSQISIEARVTANDVFGGRRGPGVGLVVGCGRSTGRTSRIGIIFLAGVGMRNDLAVALADAALEIHLVARVQPVESPETDHCDHGNNNCDFEGRKLLLDDFLLNRYLLLLCDYWVDFWRGHLHRHGLLRLDGKHDNKLIINWMDGALDLFEN